MEIPPGYTGYPRQQGDYGYGDPPRRARVGAIGDAWAVFQQDLSAWLLASLIIVIAEIAVQTAMFERRPARA